METKRKKERKCREKEDKNKNGVRALRHTERIHQEVIPRVKIVEVLLFGALT